VRGRPDGDEDDGSQEEGVAGRRGAAQDPARSPIQLQAGGRQGGRTAAADRGREGCHPAVPERPFARIARLGPPGSLASLESARGTESSLLRARGGALACRRPPPGRQTGQERFRRLPTASRTGNRAEDGRCSRLEAGHPPIRSALGRRHERPAAACHAGGGVAAVRLHLAQARLHLAQARLHLAQARLHLAQARLHLAQARLHPAQARLHPAQARLHRPQARPAAVRLHNSQGRPSGSRLRRPQARLAAVRLHRPQARLAAVRLHNSQARPPGCSLRCPRARLAAVRLHNSQARPPGCSLRCPQAWLAALRLRRPEAGLRRSQAGLGPPQALERALCLPRCPRAGSLPPPRRPVGAIAGRAADGWARRAPLCRPGVQDGAHADPECSGRRSTARRAEEVSAAACDLRRVGLAPLIRRTTPASAGDFCAPHV
jgi:hypothetical protein